MKKFFTLLLCLLTGALLSQASPRPATLPLNAPAKAPAGYSELSYAAADWDQSTGMKFYASSSKVKINSSYLMIDARSTNDAQSLVVEFTATENGKFCFDLDLGTEYVPINVYCDNELVKTMIVYDQFSTYFVDVEAGEHQIKFVADANSTYYYLKNIGVINMPLITVNLYEPGSLGTEILYNDVERLQDVRNLKIIGTLNDDDLAKISMMKDNLVRLDLSETTLTELPEKLFYQAKFLNEVILPQNLKKINDYAFAYCFIENIELPETLEYIGKYAFAYSSVKEVIMPESVTSIGNYAFNRCYQLTNVKMSNNITVIPDGAFYECNKLQNFDLPAGLTSIGSDAFRYCWYINMDFPSSLTNIGSYAFYNTNSIEPYKTTLVIPEGCSISSYAFSSTRYTEAILPTSYYRVTTTLPESVKKIRLNSPTVVNNDNYGIVSSNKKANVTLEVPKHLVNYYKLDSYWYTFKEIIGFESDEIDLWNVRADLVLNAHDRLLGTPSINIYNAGSIKINGTDGMPLNNLHINTEIDDYYAWKCGRIYSNAEGVTIDGDLTMDMTLSDAKTWYFLSLPFDIKISEIQHLDGGMLAIRYYDGANRALNGATGSWTNYDPEAVITAGTGFIINSSVKGTIRFTSLDNDSKQYITSNQMFATPLEANTADIASNQGWNLVGNPYQCYYNIHKLNFTAPITIYDKNKKYSALSIIDDDYALEPNQAFFVQCPSGVAAITFPTDGRQMTSEILSQQGAPAHNPQPKSRLITDITVSLGDDSDRTRIVLNESASVDYEMSCDASKFFSDNTSVVQLYTIEDAEYLAINERPMADGIVKLGFIAGSKGRHTISVTRNENEHVYLTDLYTGVETEITDKDYVFESEAGTFEDRFILKIENSLSLIQSVDAAQLDVKATDGKLSVGGQGLVEVYNISGVKVASMQVNGNATIDVAPGIYIVKTAQGAVKVNIN